MEQLYCYSFWKRNDIKKTWSGTAYALFNGLKAYYNTQIVDRNLSFVSRQLVKLYEQHHLLVAEKLFYYIQNLFLSLKSKKNTPVLMISEVLKTSSPSYLYFDNIWATEHLFLLLSEKESFTKWSYKNVFHYYSKSSLEYNIKRQLDIMRNCKAIFCMGKWLEIWIKEHYPELAMKTYHVGGGINTTPTYRGGNSHNYNILFIGRDFYRKGGDIVIEAFYELKKSIPKAQLTIAGADMKFAKYYPDVEFVGDISNEEVSKLMSMADLFCMPSRFEAYGLVFIEALAAGVPCIGRNMWEMPYFIEEHFTGELLQNESVKELADKMHKILTNPQYKINVLARHDFYIKEYSWEKVCKQINDIIIKTR